MNWNQIEGNWEQFKGKVQAEWGRLTDDELDVIDGNRKQLAGKLQERYGKREEEIERDIEHWISRQ
ncbi:MULTISPECIES: CsbD family protein [Cohaesibacter]|uniref:CsbD family protein n=1 Tax=Cohaesibacter TaxID=655352 RepID=UPI000DE85ED6|nr:MULTISPECIES: CsbD family protein [Cohaesibacter]TLP49287.1 CsbD family protein [Cohaesibacter sp. CAU 1516]